MFLWSRLPDGIDAADVAREALAENIVLAPGNAFSLSQSATSFLRFNVAQSQDVRVFEMLRKAIARRSKIGCYLTGIPLFYPAAAGVSDASGTSNA